MFYLHAFFLRLQSAFDVSGVFCYMDIYAANIAVNNF